MRHHVDVLARYSFQLPGPTASYLIEITAEVLAHTDAATGEPFVDVVLDQAEQKGTGRWTVQIALDLGVPVSGIAEAVFARSVSGHADLRKASRHLAGPSARRLGKDEAAGGEGSGLGSRRLREFLGPRCPTNPWPRGSRPTAPRTRARRLSGLGAGLSPSPARPGPACAPGCRVDKWQGATSTIHGVRACPRPYRIPLWSSQSSHR